MNCVMVKTHYRDPVWSFADVSEVSHSPRQLPAQQKPAGLSRYRQLVASAACEAGSRWIEPSFAGRINVRIAHGSFSEN